MKWAERVAPDSPCGRSSEATRTPALAGVFVAFFRSLMGPPGWGPRFSVLPVARVPVQAVPPSILRRPDFSRYDVEGNS